MPHQVEALKEELLDTDAEYRRLFEEHQDSEKRLQELYAKSMLSQDDENLEKHIKLHKLVLKDRMEAIVRAHRESGVTV